MNSKLKIALVAGFTLTGSVIFILNRSQSYSSESSVKYSATDEKNRSAVERLGKPRDDDRKKWEDQNKKADEVRAAAEEQMMRSRTVFNADTPPVIVSIGSDQRLSESAIQQLRLTPSQIEEVNQVLTQASEAEVKSLLSRAEYIEGHPGTDNYAYHIRAKTDRGESSRNEFNSKIEAILGTAAEQFISGMTDFGMYGNFGKYDIEVSFRLSDGQYIVTNKFISPLDGKVTRYGEGALEDPEYKIWDMLKRN